MALNIITQQTNSTLKTGTTVLQLDTVSVSVMYQDVYGTNYFSGNITLTADEDGISLQSTVDDFRIKAIAKAKSLIDGAVDKLSEPEPLPVLNNIETKETEEQTEPTDKNSVAIDGVTEEKAEVTNE